MQAIGQRPVVVSGLMAASCPIGISEPLDSSEIESVPGTIESSREIVAPDPDPSGSTMSKLVLAASAALGITKHAIINAAVIARKYRGAGFRP